MRDSSYKKRVVKLDDSSDDDLDRSNKKSQPVRGNHSGYQYRPTQASRDSSINTSAKKYNKEEKVPMALLGERKLTILEQKLLKLSQSQGSSIGRKQN